MCLRFRFQLKRFFMLLLPNTHIPSSAAISSHFSFQMPCSTQRSLIVSIACFSSVPAIGILLIQFVRGFAFHIRFFSSSNWASNCYRGSEAARSSISFRRRWNLCSRCSLRRCSSLGGSGLADRVVVSDGFDVYDGRGWLNRVLA